MPSPATAAATLLPRATFSTRWEVFHRAEPAVNPDASLSVFAVGDSDAGVRHGQNGPGVFSGNVDLPLDAIAGGRSRRTAYRSRYCPGRSGCRSPPGSDNGHSGTDGRCPASAAPADESWIRTRAGEILCAGPCIARCWGAASGRLWRSRPVPRLSQRPPRSNRFRLARHPPFGPTADHQSLPVSPPSGDRCSPPSLVIRRVIHRLSACLRNRLQQNGKIS
jgi:hypothetical protein